MAFTGLHISVGYIPQLINKLAWRIKILWYKVKKVKKKKNRLIHNYWGPVLRIFSLTYLQNYFIFSIKLPVKRVTEGNDTNWLIFNSIFSFNVFAKKLSEKWCVYKSNLLVNEHSLSIWAKCLTKFYQNRRQLYWQSVWQKIHTDNFSWPRSVSPKYIESRF